MIFTIATQLNQVHLHITVRKQSDRLIAARYFVSIWPVHSEDLTIPTEIKVGIDDIIASATTGVLRAFEARKVRVEGMHFGDLVKAGFNVDFIIRAGGRINPDILGHGGLPGQGGFGGGISGGIAGQ